LLEEVFAQFNLRERVVAMCVETGGDEQGFRAVLVQTGDDPGFERREVLVIVGARAEGELPTFGATSNPVM